MSCRSLRLARLATLQHPFSVDLYVAQSKATFVLVRLLGGLDYWRYGVDELAASARQRGFHLAVIPGDDRADERLDAASTLPAADLHRLWRCFQEGGAGNVEQALRWAAMRSDGTASWREPAPVPAAGVFAAGCRPAVPGAPRALILFYRSLMLAADTAPITALADALVARGLAVTSLYLSSLKEGEAQAVVRDHIASEPPDVIVNTTAFSARRGSVGAATDGARAPVLQAVLSTGSRKAWAASGRGLAATDLAMNVVLPEVDGRVLAGALSFKADAGRHDGLEFDRLVHAPEPSRVDHVADLAAAWAALRRTPRGERRIACVLSDYPGREGRTGYARGPRHAGEPALHRRPPAGAGVRCRPLAGRSGVDADPVRGVHRP